MTSLAWTSEQARETVPSLSDIIVIETEPSLMKVLLTGSIPLLLVIKLTGLAIGIYTTRGEVTGRTNVGPGMRFFREQGFPMRPCSALASVPASRNVSGPNNKDITLLNVRGSVLVPRLPRHADRSASHYALDVLQCFCVGPVLRVYCAFAPSRQALQSTPLVAVE